MKPELIALVFLIIYAGVVGNGTREEFEKSEHLKERLAICWYDEKIGCYLSIQMCDYASASYLNGACYAFQEQQKKIDSMLDHVCGKREDFK